MAKTAHINQDMDTMSHLKLNNWTKKKTNKSKAWISHHNISKHKTPEIENEKAICPCR